jgi:hypothetical protein
MMRRQWITGLTTALLAMMLSACNEWGPHQSVSSPSDDPALTASIRAPLLQTIGDNTNNVLEQPMFACSLDGQFTGPLDIVMTAGQNVDLNQVSIWLLDSNFQTFTSDVNTFSHEDLVEDFVTTQIPAGTIRTLRFHTNLRCGLRTPTSVATDIRFIEASGRKNSITVTTPFQATVVVRTP